MDQGELFREGQLAYGGDVPRHQGATPYYPNLYGGPQVRRRSISDSPERRLLPYANHEWAKKCRFCPQNNGRAIECPNGRCGRCCEALPGYLCARHGCGTYPRVSPPGYRMHPESAR